MGPTQTNQVNGMGQNAPTSAPVNNRATASVAGPAPAANSAPAAPQENMMAAGVSAKKSGKGMAIGLVLCLLLAAGGIGFGVWAMMDGNSRVDSLNEQISALKTQNSELLDKLNNNTVSGNGTANTVETPVSGSDVETADYIYVGEWGIKIRMPEDLKIVNYSLSESGYGEHLSVAGAREKVDGVLPKYASLDMYAGSIVRSSSDDGFYPYGTLVYTDNVGKKYYYEGPNGIPDLSEDEYKLWEDVKDLFKNALTDSENFSEI